MRDPAFRGSQMAGLDEPHVRALNRLVDELGGVDGRGEMPHIAPIYGGSQAELLCVLQSPARTARDSGVLSLENDDYTAEHLATLLDGARIPVCRVSAWNAYPWYVDHTPTVVELEEGLEPMRRVLQLLKRLKVVMLLGQSAQKSWRMFQGKYPEIASHYRVICTYHPSRQAYICSDLKERRRRCRQHEAAFSKAAQILGAPAATVAVDDARKLDSNDAPKPFKVRALPTVAIGKRPRRQLSSRCR